MEEKPSYYAIIPANIRYDKSLKANEKLLYGEITCLTQSTGKCFASNEYFANLYDTTKETISRWISNLSQKGYIKTQLIYKDGTKQIINRYIQINQEGIDKNINSPIDEKVKDNTTSINTTSIIKENIKENIKEKIKEKIKENLLSDFLKENSGLRKYDDFVKDFIAYRKQIKKTLKTIAPIKLYINSLIELENLGYSFEYCIEQMKANEWQTLKVEYIHKPNKPQQKSRAEINREFIEKHYGINEDGNIIDTEII